VDTRYLEYCYGDPYFYEIPLGRMGGAGQSRAYRHAAGLDWAGWRTGAANGWFHVQPEGVALPRQGWKIHVSATLDNAQELLESVAAYCNEHQIPFKYLPSSADLMRNNVKYAGRGGSGKFVTIYPSDDEHCERVVRDLDGKIGGADGPYILSDLRWQAGPLYLRYGGFALQQVRNESDELVAAIEAPDGSLVPDERGPVFRPPAWVETPAFVREQLERMGSDQRPESFPYEVREALHFSNGGGIYVARALADDQTVVIKEARPFAGLTPDGRDAVTRLEREAQFLQEFSDVPNVVRMRDYLVEGGHHFLVEEFVEGRTLNKEMVMRNPLVRGDQTREDRIEYRDWVLGLMTSISETVEQFHERRVVFGDLHPNNLMITSDGEPRFIDFEMAYRFEETDVAAAGAPGYMAPDARTGPGADRYSLAAMRLGLFVPLTVLLALDDSKLEHLVEGAQERFELDDAYCDAILRDAAVELPKRPPSPQVERTRLVVRGWDVETVTGIEQISRSIGRGAWENLDLSRRDRAFPGDIRQFTENGFGLAHGACGNLLSTPGEPGAQEEVFDWVLDGISTSSNPVAPGFYDGIAGVAYTARRLGRDELADALIGELVAAPLERLTSDLFGGLAGIGCFLLAEARRDAGMGGKVGEALMTVRSVLAERLAQGAPHIRLVNDTPTVETGKGGMMRGLTGQALFWLESFEAGGDPGDLDRARQAIEIDLGLCQVVEDGSIQLNEGWRTLPYLASGSAGVGVAMTRFLKHSDVPEWQETLAGIELAVRADFVIQSNLFNGRAGLVVFLAHLLSSGQHSATTQADLERHVRQLGTYAVVNRTGIHFPGEQIMRLSTDWATGSAGVKDTLDLYARLLAGGPGGAMGVPLIGVDRLYTSPASVDGDDVGADGASPRGGDQP
jgi:tRNA A-37 threonylcarbamoyl transferase component Bud32